MPETTATNGSIAALESALNTLVLLFQQPTAADADEPNDAGAVAVIEVEITRAEEALSNFVVVCEHAHTQAEAVLVDVTALHAVTNESVEALRGPIEALVQELSDVDENVREAATDALSQTIERAKESISGAADLLQTSLAAAEEVFETTTNSIDERLQNQLADTSNEFLDLLQGSVRNPLVETLEHVQQEAELRIGGLRDSTLAAAALTFHRLESSLDKLPEQLQSEGRQALEGARDRLVDAAARRLSEAVTEMITQSGVAATLSGAITPAMPTMLAIKQLANSLVHAIEAWKSLRMGL